MEKFELSRIQAQAILDLRLQRLTALEADKIQAEHAEVIERIKELREILGDEQRVRDLIKEELLEIKRRLRRRAAHGDHPLRGRHRHRGPDRRPADGHRDHAAPATSSRLPLATYRKQHRGGVGVTGMDMKDEDYIEHLFVCSTHDYLLFFTNRGKVYRQKVYELPEAARTAKGRALVNLLPLREGEFVRAVLSTRDFTEGKYLVFATQEGPDQEDRVPRLQHADQGRRHHRDQDPRRRRAGRRAPHRAATTTSSWSRARARRRASTRSRRARWAATPAACAGMNVSRGDNCVLAMDVARDDTELLVVTENGYGKRTPIAEYPVKGRGAMGVKTISLTEKKGGVAGALIVREHQDLVFISQSGMVQRTGVKGISKQGRPAQGVRVMNLREDDMVSAVALVMEDEADTSAVVDGDAEGLQPIDELPADGARASEADGASRRTSAVRGATTPRGRGVRRTLASACAGPELERSMSDQGKEVVLTC